jgi:1,4-alpha-glucan branching enzyme
MHEPDANEVRVVGSWDGWSFRGTAVTRIAPGLWRATLPALSPGSYAYKLVVDGSRWITDPANRRSAADGFGGRNSTFEVC